MATYVYDNNQLDGDLDNASNWPGGMPSTPGDTVSIQGDVSTGSVSDPVISVSAGVTISGGTFGDAFDDGSPGSTWSVNGGTFNGTFTATKVQISGSPTFNGDVALSGGDVSIGGGTFVANLTVSGYTNANLSGITLSGSNVVVIASASGTTTGTSWVIGGGCTFDISGLAVASMSYSGSVTIASLTMTGASYNSNDLSLVISTLTCDASGLYGASVSGAASVGGASTIDTVTFNGALNISGGTISFTACSIASTVTIQPNARMNFTNQQVSSGSGQWTYLGPVVINNVQLPDPASVITGTSFGLIDAMEGTTGQDTGNYVTVSEDRVYYGTAYGVGLFGTLTVPAVGFVASGVNYGIGGSFNIGTLVLPSAANVRSGVVYGTNGTGSTGTLRSIGGGQRVSMSGGMD